jgi:tRNA (guanine-N7-)-methyltransferase
MKRAQDLKIPFTWEQRHPVLLDRFFYIPGDYAYEKKNFAFFEDEKPVVIEYCSGNGQWIGERAKQNSHLNFLAIEKKFERARKIWLKIHREEIPNLSVVCGEGHTFTCYYAPKASECYINFPDPWPKLRHAKHRLVRKEFLEEVARICSKVTCATDDPNYFQEMEGEFAKVPIWKQVFKSQDLEGYGNSFFKDLWLQKGRTIYYLSYETIA